MKYSNEELEKMWEMGEKDIYNMRLLAKKNNYTFKGLYSSKREFKTKLEKTMYTYKDENGNTI